MGSHRSNDLQSDWNIFGPDNFEFGIFDELKSKEIATELEIKKDLNDLLELHKVELYKKGMMLY